MNSISTRVPVVVLAALALSIVAGCGAQGSAEPEAGTLEPLTPTVTDVSPPQDSPQPVTGAWIFTIRSEQGTGTPTVMFEQVGDSVTGHYSSTLFGEAQLEGTVKGRAIAFTVLAEWEGTKRDLDFTGEYDGSEAIKGIYSTVFGNGTFTAVRK